MTKIVNANIVTCFDAETVGSKVVEPQFFGTIVRKAVEAFDFAGQRVPGQGFIMLDPIACSMVSAGVGKHTHNPEHYVVRSHRGKVGAFLRREHAEKATGVAVVVYTTEAYLADPDCDPAERARVLASEATHVLVCVLAFAGPKSPLPVYTFVRNLAGANNEALAWSADEIRAKAREVVDYADEWCVVAD